MRTPRSLRRGSTQEYQKRLEAATRLGAQPLRRERGSHGADLVFLPFFWLVRVGTTLFGYIGAPGRLFKTLATF